MSALSGAQHLAGSGRTSFPVDKALPRDAYRVLGYKQCGERAVRVDILERLADLIRPALSWRETSPGTKPAGAFDGRSFVVTQAMTSLTGSAGEDFASVLRALGYRSEKRAPLPPKPVVEEAAPVEAAPAEAAPAEAGSEEVVSSDAVEAVATEGATSELVATAETADLVDVSNDAPPVEATASPSAAMLPDVAFAVPDEAPAPVEAAAVEAQPVEAEAIEAQSIEVVSSEVPQEAAAAPSEAPQGHAAVEAAADGDAVVMAPDAAPAVPEMVEVWRAGGRSEERRPRHDRSRHQRPQGNQAAAQEGTPAATGEAGAGEKREHHRRRRNNDFRKPRTDAPVVAASAPADGAAAPAEARPDQRPDQRNDRGRPPRERFEGKDREKGDRPNKFQGNRDGNRDNKGDRNKGGRDFGGRDKGGRDKRDSGPSHRQWATSAAPRERDRPIDPNSPFAKLAALKEQLAGNRKD
jgi:ATP-dependent RNA helicase SUPV3L1/SUV3